MTNKTDFIIDELLVFMNNTIEESGDLINEVFFNFNETGEDSVSFTKANDSLSYDDFFKVIKICISRKYIKTMYRGVMDRFTLTESGQARAISYKYRDEKAVSDNAAQVYINNLTNHNGNVAVGNRNTQTANITIQELIDRIESSNATDTEKEEAKNLLSKFIKHPLVNTALGAGATALTALLGA